MFATANVTAAVMHLLQYVTWFYCWHPPFHLFTARGLSLRFGHSLSLPRALPFCFYRRQPPPLQSESGSSSAAFSSPCLSPTSSSLAPRGLLGSSLARLSRQSGEAGSGRDRNGLVPFSLEDVTTIEPSETLSATSSPFRCVLRGVGQEVMGRPPACQFWLVIVVISDIVRLTALSPGCPDARMPFVLTACVSELRT